MTMKCDVGLPPGFHPWGGKIPWGRDRLLTPGFSGFLCGSAVNQPAMRETWVRSPGREDTLGIGKATHSSILAWRIPRTVWSMGSQRDATLTFTFPESSEPPAENSDEPTGVVWGWKTGLLGLRMSWGTARVAAGRAHTCTVCHLA